MTPEAGEKALLALVAEYRERACSEALGTARAAAARLMTETYRTQRALLSQHIHAERARARGRIEAARAERATRERTASDRARVELLALAWPMLRERLLARWREPTTRRRWAETYLRQAARVLPAGRWTIRHAPDWDASERAALIGALADLFTQPPEWLPDPRIAAGLTITSGNALMDASLDGMLEDQASLQARLLAHLSAAADPAGGPAVGDPK